MLHNIFFENNRYVLPYQIFFDIGCCCSVGKGLSKRRAAGRMYKGFNVPWVSQRALTAQQMKL